MFWLVILNLDDIGFSNLR